jgi:hypothetical protein
MKLWINNHKDEAVQAFNMQVKKLTGKSIPIDELKQAFQELISYTIQLNCHYSNQPITPTIWDS